jgi:hypothetical protein
MQESWRDDAKSAPAPPDRPALPRSPASALRLRPAHGPLARRPLLPCSRLTAPPRPAQSALLSFWTLPSRTPPAQGRTAGVSTPFGCGRPALAAPARGSLPGGREGAPACGPRGRGAACLAFCGEEASCRVIRESPHCPPPCCSHGWRCQVRAAAAAVLAAGRQGQGPQRLPPCTRALGGRAWQAPWGLPQVAPGLGAGMGGGALVADKQAPPRGGCLGCMGSHRLEKPAWGQEEVATCLYCPPAHTRTPPAACSGTTMTTQTPQRSR